MAKFPMPGDNIYNKNTGAHSKVIASSYFTDDIAHVVLLNKVPMYYSVAELSLKGEEVEFIVAYDHEHIFYAVNYGEPNGTSLGYMELGGGGLE